MDSSAGAGPAGASGIGNAENSDGDGNLIEGEKKSCTQEPSSSSTTSSSPTSSSLGSTHGHGHSKHVQESQSQFVKWCGCSSPHYPHDKFDIDCELVEDIRGRMILHWNYRNLREIPLEVLNYGEHIEEIYLKRNCLEKLVHYSQKSLILTWVGMYNFSQCPIPFFIIHYLARKYRETVQLDESLPGWESIGGVTSGNWGFKMSASARLESELY